MHYMFKNSCTNPDLDILVLIETHHKLYDEISPLLQAHWKSSTVVHTMASAADPYAGIVVLISDKLTL